VPNLHQKLFTNTKCCHPYRCCSIANQRDSDSSGFERDKKRGERFLNEKQTPQPLFRKRTIPTAKPQLVGEVSDNICEERVVVWSAQRAPTAVNLGFLDRSRYYFVQVAPHLSSRGWVDPVSDPLLLTKSSSAGNRTRDLSDCSQKL
jgi:hypothetical protein